jgi:hypothetical protein
MRDWFGVTVFGVNCVCNAAIQQMQGKRKTTSLVEGYQKLRCDEEYPGSLGRGSFPGIFQGED